MVDSIDLKERDAFYWYCQMDKATTVAAKKVGLIQPDNAAITANAITSVIEHGKQLTSNKPTDYLQVQSILHNIGGSDVSRMHSGRSRQCMLATLHRLFLRDRFVHVLFKLNEVRELMLKVGFQYAETIVPAYTNGVQAQPVTFGHLMCGYEAALQRTTQRFIENYKRLNMSPLGAAALATTRFKVDRPYLAQLLGFDSCAENAFDAAQIAVFDVGAETAQNASLIGLSLSTFIQDIHVQFHHSKSWILIDNNDLFSPSTLMPQKRNPVVLNRARLLASELVGASVTAIMVGHNVNSGMTDYKRFDAAHTLNISLNLLDEVAGILKGIRIDNKAALNEICQEYSTSSELVAAMQDIAHIPLSVGHSFVSKLVDVSRIDGVSLQQMHFEKVKQIYYEVINAESSNEWNDFPLDEYQYLNAIDPSNMVNSYNGLGGSSPLEVIRMLDVSKENLENDRIWLANTIEKLNSADVELNYEFSMLNV
jgi:argininosuccinate lyase